MTKAGAYQPLFEEVNRQLEANQIIVKQGALVDASVIETPLRPKGKTNYEVTKDREDEKEVEVDKKYPDSVDKEAGFQYQPMEMTDFIEQMM